MDREVAKQIRESRKEGKARQASKKKLTTLTAIKRMVKRELTKQQQTNFIVVSCETWITIQQIVKL
jgi:hypothetical protein